MNEFLTDFREKRKEYENNLDLVNTIIDKANKAAKKEAEEVMVSVKNSMKINYF